MYVPSTMRTKSQHASDMPAITLRIVILQLSVVCRVHPSPAMQHITNRTEACVPGVFDVQAEQTEETHGDRKLSAFQKSLQVMWSSGGDGLSVTAVCVCVSTNQTVGLYGLHVLWALFGD